MLLAEIIREHAPRAKRVVFETGPLSTWFDHAPTSEGVPAIRVEARHARKILNETLNKTDANDADGLAQLAEAGFCKAVGAKGFDAMRTRALIGIRNQIVGMSIRLSNQIRGVTKTFGLVAPKGKGRVFDGDVRDLLNGKDDLARIIPPLPEAWRDMRGHAASPDRQLLAAARRLRAIPGIGAITSLAFAAAIEDPGNFGRSRSVGAWPGLTTRRYPSGEVDCDGHISRRGDSHLRSLLHEAATVMLARTGSGNDSGLKAWGPKLRERLGVKRAAAAVARKLAVIMHGMPGTGEAFNTSAGEPAEPGRAR